MQSNFDVLIDSDAFVGRFFENDAHHKTCLSIFSELERTTAMLVTTSMVIAEVATVLSHRSGQPLARQFLEQVERIGVPVVHIDEALQQQATQIFIGQNQKGTSMTDCANVAVMRQFEIPEIFSFDEVYAKRFGLGTAKVGASKIAILF